MISRKIDFKEIFREICIGDEWVGYEIVNEELDSTDSLYVNFLGERDFYVSIRNLHEFRNFEIIFNSLLHVKIVRLKWINSRDFQKEFNSFREEERLVALFEKPQLNLSIKDYLRPIGSPKLVFQLFIDNGFSVKEMTEKSYTLPVTQKIKSVEVSKGYFKYIFVSYGKYIVADKDFYPHKVFLYDSLEEAISKIAIS